MTTIKDMLRRAASGFAWVRARQWCDFGVSDFLPDRHRAVAIVRGLTNVERLIRCQGGLRLNKWVQVQR